MSVKSKVKRCNKEIKRLQEELEMYKDFKEIANTKIGDANPLKVLEVNKILDRQCKRQQIILNKVTDKLKEDIKEITLPYTIVDGRRNSKTLEYGKKLGRIETLKEILNIIEGEKK